MQQESEHDTLTTVLLSFCDVQLHPKQGLWHMLRRWKDLWLLPRYAPDHMSLKEINVKAGVGPSTSPAMYVSVYQALALYFMVLYCIMVLY
jgi:hypothetical protein